MPYLQKLLLNPLKKSAGDDSETDTRDGFVSLGITIDALPADGEPLAVGDSHFAVHLSAGAGARLSIRMRRYVNQPTFAFPWDR